MDAFCRCDGQWRKDMLERGIAISDQTIAGRASW